MLMSRKIWLVLAIAALVAVSFAASVVAARRTGEPRSRYTTHALDYLHARQGADAGFTNPENTAWAILGMIAKRERQGTSAWRVKGVDSLPVPAEVRPRGVGGQRLRQRPRLLLAPHHGLRRGAAGQPGRDRRQQEHQPARRAVEVPGHVRRLANKGAFSALPGTHERRHPQHRLGHPRHVRLWRTTPRPTRTSRPRGSWLASQQNDAEGRRLLEQRAGAARQRAGHRPGDPGARGRPVGRRLECATSRRRSCRATRTPRAASPTSAQTAARRPTRPPRPSRPSRRWARTRRTGRRGPGPRSPRSTDCS